MPRLQLFYVFMTSLFLALVMVPGLRRWAIEKRQLDQPDHRKTHVRPRPRLGGVAIFIAFLFALLLFDAIDRQVRGILAGALVLFVTGFVDDLYGLSPRHKFLGEIVGCLVTIVISGLYIGQLGNLFGTGTIQLPMWAGVPFTVFAVVGVVNAINLLDGLDGLAGGFSALALGAFLLLAMEVGNAPVMTLCAALMGGLFGFLRYNAYPARIFMGDAGSLTLGFLLGFLAVFLTQQPAAGVQPVIPFILLGLPIIDTVRVMGERLLQGGHPFRPDRTHVHHRILDLGFSHRFTVLALHGLTLLWALVALFLRQLPEHVLLAGYLLLSLVFYGGLRALGRQRERWPLFRNDSEHSLRETALYRTLSGWVAKTNLLLTLALILFLVRAGVHPVRLDGQSLVLSLLLPAVSILTLLMTRSYRHPFLLSLLFSAGLFIAFLTGEFQHPAGAASLLPGFLNSHLFVVSAAVIGLRILFRQDEPFHGHNSLDLLLAAMCLSVAVFAPALNLDARLPEVIFKGMVLFAACKILAFKAQPLFRWVFLGMHGVLLTFVVRGMVG